MVVRLVYLKVAWTVAENWVEQKVAEMETEMAAEMALFAAVVMVVKTVSSKDIVWAAWKGFESVE